MRLSYITILLSLVGIIYAILPAVVQAQITCGGTVPGPCSGPCGVQEITYATTFSDSIWVQCPGGQCPVLNCTDNNPSCNGNAYDPYSTDPFCPNGFPNVTCTQTCDEDTSCPGGNDGCAYETAQIICDCDLSDDPTPQPSEPEDGGGGGTATPTPTPTTSLIRGRINLDVDAALSGNYCTQATASPLSLTGWSLNATKIPDTFPATFGSVNTYIYSIDTGTTGTGYTVSLDLSGQVDTNYVCSCPAPADPNNPYLCRYTGVTSPTANVNFYLREYNLSNNSWFQVFGSNYFAYNIISSPVPATTCEDDPDCIAALAAPSVDQNNPLSAGFPVVNASNPNVVRSSASSSVYHAYFHPATRPSNLNSYALGTELAPLSYEYFYQLAETSLTEIGNGEDLEPLLADFTSAPWWQTDEVNYVKINGNVSIDETQGFQLSSDQQLVVFVDGNLTLDDSNPGDSI